MKWPHAVGCLSVLLALLWVSPAVAHHSFSGIFDVSKKATLKGRISKIDWVNSQEKSLANMQDLTHHKNI